MIKSFNKMLKYPILDSFRPNMVKDKFPQKTDFDNF